MSRYLQGGEIKKGLPSPLLRDPDIIGVVYGIDTISISNPDCKDGGKKEPHSPDE